MLVYLSYMASTQSKATEKTYEDMVWLLNYAASKNHGHYPLQGNWHAIENVCIKKIGTHPEVGLNEWNSQPVYAQLRPSFTPQVPV